MDLESIKILEERRLAFGRELQAKRAERGFSREDLAYTTRISLSFVEALEEGKFHDLPGVVFGKGFVKNIVKILDFDSHDILEAYDRCWDPSDSRLKDLPKGTRPVKPPKYDLANTMSEFVRLLFAVPPRMVIWPAVVLFGVATIITLSLYLNPRTVVEGLREKSHGIATNWHQHVDRFRNGSWFHRSKVISGTGKTATSSYTPTELTDRGAIDDTISGLELTTPQDQPELLDSALTAMEDLAAPTITTNEVSPPKVPEERTKIAKEPIAKKAPEKKVNITNSDRTLKIVTTQGIAEKKSLKVVVRSPVVLRIKLDKDEGSTETYYPRTYQFHFWDEAQLIIFDTAAAEVWLNDKIIRPFGEKGKIQRISLSSKNLNTPRSL